MSAINCSNINSTVVLLIFLMRSPVKKHVFSIPWQMCSLKVFFFLCFTVVMSRKCTIVKRSFHICTYHKHFLHARCDMIILAKIGNLRHVISWAWRTVPSAQLVELLLQTSIALSFLKMYFSVSCILKSFLIFAINFHTKSEKLSPRAVNDQLFVRSSSAWGRSFYSSKALF